MYVCVCVCVCVCVRVCVYVCYHSTGHNFYPIYTKFGAQVGLLKSKVKFEDGLWTTSLIFDLKVSLDSVY